MRILVTAGPTREPLDAVRFLGNASSGRMGFACAGAARRAGHRVTLVSGPVDLPVPRGVRIVRVTTAREMRRAVLEAFPRADAVIMAAAVADYRPARRFPGKIRKGRRELVLRLVPTPDILRELGARKGRRILVGFALEARNARREALRKAREKNLDLVILNAPAAIGAGRVDAVALRGGRAVRRFRRAPKETLAAWIVAAVEELAAGKAAPEVSSGRKHR